ncbi:acyltransferase family protein [uncultured Hymenobacter sp.]|uniref:acyltransferase family protein n=1 Tax=uncultured Hymenobacter sp. TaxID=170016 RepID=UPI0035CA6861
MSANFPTPLRELKGLTGLRFLAALYVFVFHLDMPHRTPLAYLPARLGNVIQQGRLGVCVFFVLSGFVLTYSHLKDFPTPHFRGKRYYLGFLYKRLARIYPVFLVGLLICLFISQAQGTLPSWKLVGLSATFLQTYIPRVSMQWYDMAAWSVANEFFFYLLFPLLLPLLLRVRRRGALLALLGGLALLSTALGVAQGAGLLRYELVFPFPPSRLAEFVAGIVGALLVFRFGWRVRPGVAVALLALTAVYLAFAGPLVSGRLTHNWLVVPTVVALLAVLAQPRQSRAFAWLESRPMQYLGRISYSFYIAQLPLVFVLDPLLASGRLSHTDWRVAPLALLINLLGGVLLHELVEKKAHAVLMRRYKRYVAARAKRLAMAS